MTIKAYQTFEEFTGLKVDNIIGKTITEIIPNKSQFNWIAFYGTIALNGENETLEQYFEHSKKDGIK